MFHNSSPVLSAAASPAFLAKGCVNVIELSSFKEHSGERWSRICEGVYARLESLLRSKLGPNDLFLRIGDIAYLVTMPTTDPEDVNAICMRVAFDLHTSFLGQCEIEQIEVSMVSAGEDDTLVLHRLPAEKVVSLAEKAGISFTPSRGTQAIESRQSPPGPQTTSISTATKGIGPTWNFVEPPPPVLTVEHHFIPIWSVRNAAVTTYACEPKTISAAGRQDSIALNQLSPKERVQVDITAFRAGIEQLAKSHEVGNRFLLAVPISFELLGTPAGRMELLAVSRNLPYSYRHFLIFIIRDVPPGVAQSRLANMVTILRPFGRSVSASIAPTQRAYGAYQGIGLRSIGFDLQEFMPQTPLAQHDVEQLAYFARQANLGTFLSNVRDKSILKYAQDANIGHLSGPAISPALTEPHSMWRLTWAETLSRPETELWV